MHKKVFTILRNVFTPIGLALLAAALITGYVAYSNPARRHGVETIATITGFNQPGQSTRVYIHYNFGGISRTGHMNFYSSSMRVGQERMILVNPDNPAQFVLAGMTGYLPVLILGPMGLSLAIVGLVFHLIIKKENRRREYLFETGVAIMADVVGVDDNWSVTVNGRPGQVLVATHGHLKFRSGLIDNNDLAAVGEQVKILLDPQDYDNYVFDFHNESFVQPSQISL